MIETKTTFKLAPLAKKLATILLIVTMLPAATYAQAGVTPGRTAARDADIDRRIAQELAAPKAKCENDFDCVIVMDAERQGSTVVMVIRNPNPVPYLALRQELDLCDDAKIRADLTNGYSYEVRYIGRDGPLKTKVYKGDFCRSRGYLH